MTDKQSLRSRFRQLRRQQAGQGAVIRDAVKAHLLARSAPSAHARCIGLYWPLADEVDLRPLLKDIQAPLALPVADGHGGLSYRLWDDHPLSADGCGIPAPAVGTDLQPEELELLLVPALAVDRHGIRLGYGGGYYDRLRADDRWHQVPALVVLPQACVHDRPLPRDPWDIPFDGWITERGSGQATASPA